MRRDIIARAQRQRNSSSFVRKGITAQLLRNIKCLAILAITTMARGKLRRPTKSPAAKYVLSKDHATPEASLLITRLRNLALPGTTATQPLILPKTVRWVLTAQRTPLRSNLAQAKALVTTSLTSSRSPV